MACNLHRACLAKCSVPALIESTQRWPASQFSGTCCVNTHGYPSCMPCHAWPCVRDQWLPAFSLVHACRICTELECCCSRAGHKCTRLVRVRTSEGACAGHQGCQQKLQLKMCRLTRLKLHNPAGADAALRLLLIDYHERCFRLMSICVMNTAEVRCAS